MKHWTSPRRVFKGLDDQGRPPEALHGAEGCADTSDEKPPMTRRDLAAAIVAVLVCWLAVAGACVQWGGA